jgi:hypothetical protein
MTDVRFFCFFASPATRRYRGYRSGFVTLAARCEGRAVIRSGASDRSLTLWMRYQATASAYALRSTQSRKQTFSAADDDRCQRFRAAAHRVAPHLLVLLMR